MHSVRFWISQDFPRGKDSAMAEKINVWSVVNTALQEGSQENRLNTAMALTVFKGKVDERTVGDIERYELAIDRLAKKVKKKQLTKSEAAEILVSYKRQLLRSEKLSDEYHGLV